MKKLLLGLLFLSSVAFGQSSPFGGSTPGVSLSGNNTWSAAQNFTASAGADAIKLTTNLSKIHLGTGTNDSFYSNGTAIVTDGSLNVGNVLSAAGIGPTSAVNLNLFSSAPDGATTLGMSFTTTNTFATAGARLFSLQNNSVQKAYFDLNGSLFVTGPTSGTGIQLPANTKLRLSASGGADWLSSDGTNITLGSNLFVGSSVVANVLATYGGFATALPGQSLPTCAAPKEGTMQLDPLGGVATGNPTRMCMCSSSGASVYTWRNLVTGTTGTATTCAN